MNEESLFAAALEMAGATERRAFLDEACGDARLRRRVEKLLAADERARGILDHGQSAAALVGAYQPPPPLAAGQLFAGRFRLARKLGEGGMGEVWVADQTEPVERQVAVKVIKAGVGSARQLDRFDHERQTLARMDHPNIGKVLDAGVDHARPFFVMELIDGAPITRYCDDARLSVRERLELFVPVCQAVQHAHQKGVIHRDLKPSNVLVALYDGKPVPKVIDFGIAKSAVPGGAGPSACTEVGTILGTLEYMSPEQAEANDLDLDTRSDVYSLGVVLYELLTGGVPFSRTQLQALPLSEMLRVIREIEPACPSARLAAETSTTTAAARCSDPNRLVSQVRGELDWIVMRCLEKDRSRRYETANALAMDLKRHLADEPVLAGPPSAGYRLRKFLRRHRGPVLAASLVLLALVGGVVGTTVGLVRAVQARQAEQLAKETAEKRLGQVEKGIDLLASVFRDLDPMAEQKEGRPLRAILGDRLDQAAAELEGDVLGDPLVVARLQGRLGVTYLRLGHAAKAEALLAKAIPTCEAHFGPDHPTTLDAMEYLGLAYREGGKVREAIALFERLWEAKARALGADDPATFTTINNLAATCALAGENDRAVALLERLRRADEARYPADHPHALTTLTNLATAYMAARRVDEGIALSERVLAAWVKKHGETHPLALGALNNLANAYHVGYKIRPAVTLLERGRTLAESSLGPDHPQTLQLLGNLARLYQASGKPAQAAALAEQLLGRKEIVLGPHHPSTLNALDTLGLAHLDAGKPDKALPLFQRAVAGIERAEFSYRQAEEMVRHLSGCHERLKQYAEAEVWRRKHLALVKAKGGPGHTGYADALVRLGSNLLHQRKHADAAPFLREGLALLQQQRPDAWETFRSQAWLGAALVGLKRYAEAEPHLVQACEGMSRWAERLGPSHGAFTRGPLTDGLTQLAAVYDALGKPVEAARWRKELETLRNPPG
jgi:non-specific serine/threonine protein kinase/serine/threonine-protein kinase